MAVRSTQSGRVVANHSGHLGTVYDVHFSTDDAYIVSASSDRTAKVFDLRGHLAWQAGQRCVIRLTPCPWRSPFVSLSDLVLASR